MTRVNTYYEQSSDSLKYTDLSWGEALDGNQTYCLNGSKFGQVMKMAM